MNIQMEKGMGKEKNFLKNGKIKYDGEYLDGKRNGIGKEYYKNGRIKYNGEFLNGQKIKNKKKFNI